MDGFDGFDDDRMYELNVSAAESGRRRHRRSVRDAEGALSREELLSSLGLSDAEVKVSALTEEEARFVSEMLDCELDKGRAWRRLHPGEDLGRNEYRKMDALLRRDDVRKLLRSAVVRRMGEVMDNLDARLLDVYIIRAFYDIADYHDPTGLCLPLSSIPEDKRVAIDRVESRYYGKDGDVYSVNYILANREKALETLREYIQGLRPKSGVGVTQLDGPGVTEEETLSEMSDEELRAELGRLSS